MINTAKAFRKHIEYYTAKLVAWLIIFIVLIDIGYSGYVISSNSFSAVTNTYQQINRLPDAIFFFAAMYFLLNVKKKA